MVCIRIPVLVALLTLAACSPGKESAETGARVDNAWVRLPAVPDRPAAAYFTLQNNGPASVLIKVESVAAQRIELHDNTMHGGMMHMVPLTEVAVRQGGAIEFKPGGKHAMMFGLDPKLKAGGALTLVFSFRDGQRLEAQARLVDTSSPPPQAP